MNKTINELLVSDGKNTCMTIIFQNKKTFLVLVALIAEWKIILLPQVWYLFSLNQSRTWKQWIKCGNRYLPGTVVLGASNGSRLSVSILRWIHLLFSGSILLRIISRTPWIPNLMMSDMLEAAIPYFEMICASGSSTERRPMYPILLKGSLRKKSQFNTKKLTFPAVQHIV